MKAIATSLFTFAFIAFTLNAGAQDKKVHNFTAKRIVKAPADKVWAVVGDDFGAIANSHPKIVSSTYINGTLKSGEGAERQCNFNEKATKYLREKMVDYDPDNRRFKVQILHADGLPINPEYSFAIYSVKAIDENTSEITMKMTYRTKPGFMGGMAKGGFKKGLNDYLLAVEHHTVTGENVNADNFKEIKKKYESR